MKSSPPVAKPLSKGVPIEVSACGLGGHEVRVAVFDFEGTLSLIRSGGVDVTWFR